MASVFPSGDAAAAIEVPSLRVRRTSFDAGWPTSQLPVTAIPAIVISQRARIPAS